MNKILYIYLGAYFILLVGCSFLRKNFCVKAYMNNHKFTYIAADGTLSSKYFIIKDTLQFEYSGNELYSESIINWKTCNEYSLIIKRIYCDEKGLQPGDTLSVKIQSVKKDTIRCIASAYNHSFPIKFFKSNIE